MKMKLSREILYQRHRLSHQQINSLFGEQQNQLVFEEKLYQLNQLSIFLEFAKLFQERNIWFLPLKGPMLSYRIYGDATCRFSRDFDFLISKSDVRATIEMFNTYGFLYNSAKIPENVDIIKRNESMLNQLTLYQPEKNITVEIHWRMFNDPMIEFNEIEELVEENIQQFEFAGMKINKFSLEFELLYLIIHGGLHKWRRLKWLLDVYEIINRFKIDKIKFESLTEKLSAQRMVGLCNVMLRHYFSGIQLPVDYSIPDWYSDVAIKEAEREDEIPDNGLAQFFISRWFLIQAFPSVIYKRKRIHVLLSSTRKIGKAISSFFIL